MADFNMKVNTEAFHRFGVEPVIDENMYGELIDEYAPQSSTLDVTVAPSIYWGGRGLLRKHREIRRGNTTLPIGSYSTNRRQILLPAHPDAERTNKLLLHETKHFIDHMNGESAEVATVMKKRLLGTIALAEAGMLLGSATGKRALRVASALSPLATLPAIYHRAPHEIAARQFANDDEVRSKYGGIITYKSV